MRLYPCLLQINARISNMRTRPKGITDKKVEGFYQLLAGDDAGSRVKTLTNEDQDYIYPAAVFLSSRLSLFLSSLVVLYLLGWTRRC